MTPGTLSRSPLNPARILVIRLRHHGDILLIASLIRALKQQYPATNVDVLLYEEAQDMLVANSDTHHIYDLDRRWKEQGKKHQLEMQWQPIQALRQQQYNMVLNLADQWPSVIINKLASAVTRISFDFPKRRHPFWHYCHTALVSTQQHNQLHAVQQNFSIPAPLSPPLDDVPARMGYSEADWTANHALLPEEFRENYITIQPASRWFSKCQCENRMSALINVPSAEGYTVVLISGPDDREKKMVDTIIAGYPQTRPHSLAGQLTPRQLAVMIDHARLFIGIDSVPMHMVATLDTPLVALFGLSKLTFRCPWQTEGEVIWAGDFGLLPGPDDINTNAGEYYFDLIPTDTVIAAAKKVLA